MFKKIVYFLLVIIIILLVISVIFVQQNKPQYSGNLQFSGLEEEVTVYFDEIGVPHIYATNENDAYKALGYVHAQDRLWQMELMRRVGSGRLAEIFGKDLIKTDKFFRGLGIKSAAAKGMASLDTTSQHYLLSVAYLEGINQYLDCGITPIEFRLLGIEKEHYTVEDMYFVFGFMSFGFAQAHKTDPLLTDIKDRLGSKYLNDLDIEVDPKTTLIRNSRKNKKLAGNIPSPVSTIMDELPVPAFIGSNSWVIGPKKTKNKKVIFANDPHMKFSQPSIWYQAHIVTPEFEIYGFNLAMSPFPLLGHNQDYAYGMTMLENDDIDFYKESKDQKYVIREEIIKVKGEDDFVFEVHIGEHGPVMNDLLDILDSEEKITMDWIYTKVDNNMMEASYEISHAGSLDDFKQGVSKIYAPGLNLMYGDAKGNIAWFGAAKLYERETNVNSKFILNGANGVDDKVSYLDFEDNPQAINPSWNYVYSANNQPEEVNGKLYPGYYVPEDRAKRIVELLEAKDVHSSSDVEMMINDAKSSVAVDLVSVILENISKVNLSETEKEAMTVLKNWDGNYELNEAGPTIYVKFIYLLLKNTFADEMGEEAFDQFLQTHLYKRQVAKQIKMNKSVWWDDINTKDVKELRDEIITRSYHEAISILEEQFGHDPMEWEWSEAIRVTHKHTFDKNSYLRNIFNVGPFKTNGSNAVINNQLFKIKSDGIYEVYAGPSTRRVIDFNDIENAKAILPTGQSGNVFSKHYKDQAEKYHKGEFVKMMLNKEEIMASDDKLIFLPQPQVVE